MKHTNKKSIIYDRQIIINCVRTVSAWLQQHSDKKLVGMIFTSIILLLICGHYVVDENSAKNVLHFIRMRIGSSTYLPLLNICRETTHNQHNQLWTGCEKAPFIDRVNLYNQVIDLNREKMLKQIANTSLKWPIVRATRLYKNWSYHLVMDNVSNSSLIVTTIYLVDPGSLLTELKLSHPLVHNYFHVKKYYRWEALQPVCVWLQKWLSHGYKYIDPISRYSWLRQLTNQTCIDSTSSHFYQQVCIEKFISKQII